MKKFLALILAAMMALTIVSALAEGTVTIGVSMNDADEFCTSWLNEFNVLAAKKGWKVISTNAASDASTQISDMESLMLQGCDVILVRPYSGDTIVAPIESAMSAGIPVVVIDIEAGSDNYTTFISDAQSQYGVVQGNYVKEWLAADANRVANVGYIVGMYSMEAALARRDGFYQTLGIEAAMAEAEGGWNADGAMAIAEDWIQAYPEMNIFCCMNDDMAIGVAQALVSAGYNMDDVLILGIDGTTAAQESMIAGEMDMSAANVLEISVQCVVDTCEEILAGNTVEKSIEPLAIVAMTAQSLAEAK